MVFACSGRSRVLLLPATALVWSCCGIGVGAANGADGSDVSASAVPGGPYLMQEFSYQSFVTSRGDPNMSQVGVSIGAMLSLDFQAERNVEGDYMRGVIETYVQHVNTERGGVRIGGQLHPIELKLLDDQGNPDLAEWIVRRFASDGIDLLLGPLGTELTARAASVAHELGNMLLLAPVGNDPAAFVDRPLVFGMQPRTDTYLTGIFKELASKDPKPTTVAFIQEDTTQMRAVCGSVADLAAEHGLSLVASSTIADDQGWRVHNAVLEVETVRPGASLDILVGCVESPVCHELLKTAQELEFNPKAMVVTGCVGDWDFRSQVGDETARYTIGVHPWTPPVEHSRPTFSGWNVTYFSQLMPGVFFPETALAALASCEVLIHAIEKAGSKNPQAVAQVLKSLNGIGILGRIGFDDDGMNVHGMRAIQFQQANSDVVVVAPSLLENGNLVYPRKTWKELPCLVGGRSVSMFGYHPDGTCNVCEEGSIGLFNNRLGNRRCFNCTPGRYWVQDTDSGDEDVSIFCARCAAGYFTDSTGLTVCEACGAGKYQDLEGQSHCELCQPGTYMPSVGATACLTCQENTYAEANQSQSCGPCPQGGLCWPNEHGLYTSFTNGDGYFLLEVGGEKTLVECLHGKGQACVQNATCFSDPETGEPSMEGLFCGECRKGFGRQGSTLLCYECPAFGQALVLSFTTTLQIIAVAIVMVVLTLVTDPLKPSGMNGIILKQVLSYMGMSKVVFQSTQLPVSVVVDALLVLSNGAGAPTSFSVLHAGDCVLREAFPNMSIPTIHALIGLLWIPFWVFGMAAIFFVYYIAWRRLGWEPASRETLVSAILVFVFIIHPHASSFVLTAFHCDDFDVPRLVADVSIECFSDAHRLPLGLGLTGLLLIVFGVPGLLFIVLRHYAKQEMLRKLEVLRMVGFLYRGFEPDKWYFECVFMLRKVIYQTVIYIPGLESQNLRDQQILQCCSLQLLAIFFLAVHLATAAYDNRNYFILDRIETASLWAIYMTVFIQTWLWLSDSGYAFVDDGSESRARQRNVRNVVAVVVLLLFHGRFWYLVLEGVLYPYRAFIMKALSSLRGCQACRHGHVEVHKHGLVFRGCSKEEEAFFMTMLEEIATRLFEDGDPTGSFFEYNQFIACLQHVCIQAMLDRESQLRKVGDTRGGRRLSHHASIKEEAGTLIKKQKQELWQAYRRLRGKEELNESDAVHETFSIDNHKKARGCLYTVGELHLAMMHLGPFLAVKKTSFPWAEEADDDLLDPEEDLSTARSEGTGIAGSPVRRGRSEGSRKVQPQALERVTSREVFCQAGGGEDATAQATSLKEHEQLQEECRSLRGELRIAEGRVELERSIHKLHMMEVEKECVQLREASAVAQQRLEEAIEDQRQARFESETLRLDLREAESQIRRLRHLLSDYVLQGRLSQADLASILEPADLGGPVKPTPSDDWRNAFALEQATLDGGALSTFAREAAMLRRTGEQFGGRGGLIPGNDGKPIWRIHSL